MFPGTDLIEIKRVDQAMLRQPRLKSRLFTGAEIEECEQKGHAAASYAGKFAAKEAVLKALGTGLRGLNWTDIEVLADPLGKPEVHLATAAYELMISRGLSTVRVSISHSRDFAIAFAIALKGEEE
ncbi:MAG: holo-ACP synthase [Peptococcaceae bacterium]|nr:holo-ACP synthase [Peptococcaceae bacterium]